MVDEDTVEADELVEVELSEVVVEAVLVEAVTGRVVVEISGKRVDVSTDSVLVEGVPGTATQYHWRICHNDLVSQGAHI